MNPHLTDEEIRLFCSRELSPERLIEADEHLSKCDACRQRAWSIAHGTDRAAKMLASAMPEPDATTQTADLPGGEHGLPSWRVPRSVRWLAAAGAAVVLLTALVPRMSRGQSFLTFELPIGIVLRAGERVTVSLAGLAGRTSPFVRTISLKVDSRGQIPELRVPDGTCAVSVVYEGKDRRPARLYMALSDIKRGRNVVRLVTERNGITDRRVLALLPREARGRWQIEGVLREAAMNFYDDVRVSTTSKLFFSESFDRADGTEAVPGLVTQWAGKGAFVSRSSGAPGARGGVWVNLAYPQYNRADRIPLRPSDVPRGEPLIIEARVLVTDPRAGIEIALSKPFRNATGLAQDTPMLMRFELGKITAHNHPDLMPFDPLRWYAVRIECDLAAHTYNVIVDGSPLATAIPMQKSNRPGIRFDFDGVILGGNWFANRQ